MKKFSLNGILNFSFKIGKVMSTFLLLIVLITILITGINLIRPASTNVRTPQFDTIAKELVALKY